MKRLTKQILGVAAAIILAGGGLVIATVIWAATTPGGSRWLLESAIPLSGISFSAKKIDGKIIDHLLLTGVRVGVGVQQVELDTVEIRWKPLLLLTGTIAIQELVVNGVRIQDDTPPDNKPPHLAWPKASANAQMFDGRIARLRVTALSYRNLKREPLLVTGFDGSVTWQDGILAINDLKGESALGKISGTVSVGFNNPSLLADLAVELTQPIAEMNRFRLQASKSEGKDPEPFVGAVIIAGSADSRKLLELSGDMGMADDAVNLRRLRLTRPGQKGVITADGSLAFTTLEPVVALQIALVDLDLAPELNVPTDLSGTLKFAGALNSYRGDFNLANRAKGWQAATVAATYAGNLEGVKLTRLNGKILDGSLTGNLDIRWHDGVALQGTISGRNLNPARLDPGWKGVANFNASGEMASSGKEPFNGSISGVILESRLHGQPLTGSLQADFADDNLSLTKLALQGKGFNIQASGELKERLVIAAQISDLSRLVPGSAGTLQAQGWLRRRDGNLSGAVVGTGNKLAYAGMHAASAKLNARLDEGRGYPLHIAATLQDAVYDGYTVQTLTIAADGTVEHHSASATLSSKGSKAELALAAGYSSGIWKGSILRLAGSDNNGPWRLSAPAAFYLSADKISLSPLVLTAGRAERLEVAAELALHPLGGRFLAQWDGVNLMRLKPWFPLDTVLEGHISGRANGNILPGERFALDGTSRLSEGTLHQSSSNGELNLSLTSATASWGWRGETLVGALSLTMADHGQMRTNFKLPLPARFPVAIDPKAPLQASVAGKLQEKGIISSLFPGLIQESFGNFDAELAVSGSWDQPQIGGTLRLAKAGAYLPSAGIHLRELQVAARLEKNLVRIDSFKALSGPGHIEGSALITLNGWQVMEYRGTVTGDNFQTVHFPELQIQTAPNLTFSGNPRKLTLRGELHLPELHIVGAPSRSNVITPSSDVIMEGRGTPVSKVSPLALDVQIRLLLGERVFVKSSGIDAQLGGGVDLSFSSLDSISSSGEIKVIKGRYRTYGVNLEIVRGRLFFAGVPVDHPNLDILALRTVGEVRAGVTVTGTLQKPVTTLYSEPAMPDVDILAYIVLGHPLGSNGEQASLVAQAAGAVLTSAQAEALQDKIKNRLGLSTLGIQGGVGARGGAMGYKPLQVTAPGAIPETEQPGITKTVLTVGKYLTPKLYISYGRSLFTGSSLFLLRYDIFKKWQIETQTGSESGVDLFYKLEFK